MVSKKAIIYTLFVSNFLFFGLGQYVTNNFSTPVGNLLSILPHLLIILFFCLDSLLGKKFSVRLNPRMGWLILFMISLAYAGVLGLSYGVPGYDRLKTLTEILKVGIPFLGFMIWIFYQVEDEDFDPVRQFRWALGLYLSVNLLGAVAGITTLAHSFEDRISIPFSDGIYDGANVLAIFAILLFPLIRDNTSSSQSRIFTLGLLFVVSALILHINSRLTILVLLLVMGLFMIRLAYVYQLIFVGAWFFIPMLLNSKMLVYNILTQPIFSSLLQRGDLEDITSYNSRAYIWERAMEWIQHDRTGFWAGNGTRGFGTLRIYEDITDQWMVDVYTLHSHSSMLDIWICQGLIGLVIVGLMIWGTLKFYRIKRQEGHVLQQFYPVVIFLLLLMQVDGFFNPSGIGFAIFLMLFSLVVVQKGRGVRGEEEEKLDKTKAPRGELLVGY